jgi:excisionase family DNA binding protein
MGKSPLLSNKLLFSLREISALTGLSLRTVAKLIASREVESIRVGRRRLIAKDALLRFTKRDHCTQSVPRKKVGR